MSDDILGVDLPLFQAPKISDAPVEASESKFRTRRSRKPAEQSDSAIKSGDDTNNTATTRSRKRTVKAETDSATDHENGKGASIANGDVIEKRVRTRNRKERTSTTSDTAVEPTSTRMASKQDSKKRRRRDGRDNNRRRVAITEADFLAKRDNIERKMVMRENNGSEQIAILEDGILVEHYVSEQAESSIVGNVYLGKVQNVLPGMEAAFVDIGVGRNGVLYAGEVNWDVSGLVDGEPKRIEHALKKNDIVMVQVTKDPVNLKGARLTSQVTFAGRYLVLVPSEGITGISKKLPDRERTRLKAIISDYITNDVGIIVRTAAQGVKEEDIIADIKRLKAKWEGIEKKAKNSKAPALLYEESDMAKQVIREQFSDEFSEIIVAGNEMHDSIKSYIGDTIPELSDRVTKWTKNTDIFKEYRIDEQLTKAFDRKVWLPSGGTLVIDRTEAMTIVDVNTGKFTGNSKNATLEQTVTFNNLEAAEEIVRQLRLRDIGGIVIIDFIDMILPDNRNKVLQRLLECLSRDRTKHQVAEITSLGLVQLTRKRVGQGLIEAFSTVCEQCAGKGYIIHSEPVKKDINSAISVETPEGWYDRIIGGSHELDDGTLIAKLDIDEEKREANKNAMAAMAQAAGLDSNSSSSADESEKEVEDGSAEVADNISTESEE